MKYFNRHGINRVKCIKKTQNPLFNSFLIVILFFIHWFVSKNSYRQWFTGNSLTDYRVYLFKIKTLFLKYMASELQKSLKKPNKCMMSLNLKVNASRLGVKLLNYEVNCIFVLASSISKIYYWFRSWVYHSCEYDKRRYSYPVF